MARPPKLTKELITQISNNLRAGAYVETAALSAGISKTIFYAWLKKGGLAESGMHRALVNAVDKAQAEAEMRDLANIDKAAMGTDGYVRNPDGSLARDKDGQPLRTAVVAREWKASAWRLERRNQKRWGTRMALTDPEGNPLSLGGGVSAEQAATEAQKIAERVMAFGNGRKPTR